MVSVLEKLKMYAQTGQSLKETQAQELQRLVEVVKPFMENECLRSVRQAKGLPLLRSYSSDTTPVKVKQVLPTNSSSSSSSSRRVGTRTLDLLMQVCFIRYQSSTDDVQTVVYVRDPVPVARKSGWCLFEAWKQFQPTLRSMNHYGIAIEHVVADRAEQSPLERHIKEHILQQHQRLSQAELPPGGVASLGNKQWVVSNPCACHDGHNSLKWALSTYMSDKETVRAVFATTRSHPALSW